MDRYDWSDWRVDGVIEGGGGMVKRRKAITREEKQDAGNVYKAMAMSICKFSVRYWQMH